MVDGLWFMVDGYELFNFPFNLEPDILQPNGLSLQKKTALEKSYSKGERSRKHKYFAIPKLRRIVMLIAGRDFDVYLVGNPAGIQRQEHERPLRSSVLYCC